MTNVFYFKKISSVGGCESWLFYLSTLYPNIVIYYQEADGEQIKRLAKNVEVHKYTKPIKCDRFFCSYGYDIEVEAKEYYHVVHYDAMSVNFTPLQNDNFKYIGVSKLACESFEKRTGKKCELIYNPMPLKRKKVKKKTDKIYLISATRLSSEKGGKRITQLSYLLDKAGIEYEWVVYTNRPHFPFKNQKIKVMPQKLDLTKEISEATYLVQLSNHESFGLSVCESLTLGTPVIVTDIPAFKEIGCKHGINAIICDLDLKNIDIELIKKGLPDFEYTPPKSNWGKYLKGESNYDKDKLVKVRTKRKIFDLETNLHYKVNQIVEIRQERASLFETNNWVEVL